ncbi:MAG: hypothetical protein IT427_09240 [Pirellulales bacterium]|nr:hypothetical protein [Pirellulales bacterium]
MSRAESGNAGKQHLPVQHVGRWNCLPHFGAGRMRLPVPPSTARSATKSAAALGKGYGREAGTTSGGVRLEGAAGIWSGINWAGIEPCTVEIGPTQPVSTGFSILGEQPIRPGSFLQAAKFNLA